MNCIYDDVNNSSSIDTTNIIIMMTYEYEQIRNEMDVWNKCE